MLLPDSITNCVLSLKGEEEARGEVFDGGSTRHKTLIGLKMKFFVEMFSKTLRTLLFVKMED